MAVASTKDLLRSHDELRAAVIVAGKEIQKLNFGRRDNPVLPILRRVLRESREVARAYRGGTGTALARVKVHLKT